MIQAEACPAIKPPEPSSLRLVKSKAKNNERRQPPSRAVDIAASLETNATLRDVLNLAVDQLAGDDDVRIAWIVMAAKRARAEDPHVYRKMHNDAAKYLAEKRGTALPPHAMTRAKFVREALADIEANKGDGETLRYAVGAIVALLVGGWAAILGSTRSASAAAPNRAKLQKAAIAAVDRHVAMNVAKAEDALKIVLRAAGLSERDARNTIDAAMSSGH